MVSQEDRVAVMTKECFVNWLNLTQGDQEFYHGVWESEDTTIRRVALSEKRSSLIVGTPLEPLNFDYDIAKKTIEKDGEQQ